jgi:hypothetical protein
MMFYWSFYLFDNDFHYLANPRSVKNCLFTVSRSTLGPTQHPMQWVPTAFSGGKEGGRDANYSPPTSAMVKKNVDLYIHFPISLHVLN